VSPVVIAHRGGAAHGPENTIPAMELGLKQGADAIEMDVWVTGDGVPVIVHDPSTRRVGDGDVAIESSPLESIRGVDVGFCFTSDQGRTFPYRGQGVTVPTLAEVLRRFPTVPILLELKSPRGQEAVRQVLDEYEARSHVVVASAMHQALRVFRDDVYCRAASRREIGWWYLGAVAGHATRSAGYQVLSIPPRKRMLHLTSRRVLATAARAHIPVHVWTIDDSAAASRLWRDGATGIITNDPERMVCQRAEEFE